jgi:outer membrane biosynthesis protein TonB
MVPHLPMPEEDDPLVTPEQEEFRRRAVRAVLIVAGIAAAIGLLIGGLTSAVLSGVLPDNPPPPAVSLEQPEEESSIPTPSLLPTQTPAPPQSASATPRPTPTPSPSPSPTPTPSPTPSPSPTKERRPATDRAIELHASEASVGSYEEVTLSGRYPGGDGTSLQVQRREGGSWAAFPTSATVQDGTFSTYVASGQSGPNAFRVVDPSTGRASNVVVVTVS